MTEEQSALRKASSDFSTSAAEHGWTQSSVGLLGLANLALNGVTEDGASKADYVSSLENTEQAMDKIAADAREAGAALADVNTLAEAYLDANADDAARADLVGFERALVDAQKARRTFVEAAEAVGAEPYGIVYTAIAEFDIEIDRARRAADELADRYAGATVAQS